MKRLLAILLALTLVLSMAACASAPAKAEENTDAPAADARPEEKSGEEETPAAEPVELIVFAAASMTETLTEIGSKFMEQNPNVTIQFNFDSSGTLKTQIQNGAECDVFISAGQFVSDASVRHNAANWPRRSRRCRSDCRSRRSPHNRGRCR